MTAITEARDFLRRTANTPLKAFKLPAKPTAAEVRERLATLGDLLAEAVSHTEAVSTLAEKTGGELFIMHQQHHRRGIVLARVYDYLGRYVEPETRIKLPTDEHQELPIGGPDKIAELVDPSWVLDMRAEIRAVGIGYEKPEAAVVVELPK